MRITEAMLINRYFIVALATIVKNESEKDLDVEWKQED